jgi:hypothetical protein
MNNWSLLHGCQRWIPRRTDISPTQASKGAFKEEMIPWFYKASIIHHTCEIRQEETFSLRELPSIQSDPLESWAGDVCANGKFVSSWNLERSCTTKHILMIWPLGWNEAIFQIWVEVSLKESTDEEIVVKNALHSRSHAKARQMN